MWWCQCVVNLLQLLGRIVVVERAPARRLQVFDQRGNFLVSVADGSFTSPRAVAVDENGNMVVVENRCMRVHVLQATGVVDRVFTCARMQFPTSVTARQRKIFVCDNRASAIWLFSYDGDVLGEIRHGTVCYPIFVTTTNDGVCAVGSNHECFCIAKFSGTGIFTASKRTQSKLEHVANVANNTSHVLLVSKSGAGHAYQL